MSQEYDGRPVVAVEWPLDTICKHEIQPLGNYEHLINSKYIIFFSSSICKITKSVILQTFVCHLFMHHHFNIKLYSNPVLITKYTKYTVLKLIKCFATFVLINSFPLCVYEIKKTALVGLRKSTIP